MSFALSAGVTGLQAHQKMLDIAGNNLANVNTTAFKSSRMTFSELLSETIKKASQPTSTVGGTNPQQMGSGVGIAGISPDMSQGNIINTGNPLDMAIEGEGYFVLKGPEGDIYTRAGSFGVDANGSLVDPATGYLIQRIGSTGIDDNFQQSGDSNIHVPYDVTLPANATSTIRVQGNLSSDSAFSTPHTQVLTSDIAFTTGSGTPATGTTAIADLDQYTGTLNSGLITFSGYKPDGTALGSSPATDLTMPVDGTTTLNNVLTWLNTDEGTAAVDEIQTISIGGGTPTSGKFNLTLNGETTGDINWNATAAQVETALEGLSGVSAGDVNCGGGALPGAGITVTFEGNLAGQDITAMTVSGSTLDAGTASVAETTKGRAVQGILGSGATASLVNGKLVITDASSGFSRTDLTLAWSGDGTLTVPAYFELTTVGGDEVKDVNITTYDSLGTKHVLSGAFVRTDTANTWDMVLTSITGDIDQITMDNRRIKDIEFDSVDGAYSGLNATTGDTSQFVVTFEDLSAQTVGIDMGTVNGFDGLTQLAGNSTAVARSQDGYESGSLTSVSVDHEGVLIGAFSNGIKRDIATIRMALFQNTAALESAGNGYYSSSANSGDAVSTQAMSAGAGSIHGGALEKSNSDVATEFVAMIQAQNGFQANARTIRVANDILRELTNLIR